MSYPTEPARVPLINAGMCSYCYTWAAKGVVLCMVTVDSGPGWCEIAHLACAEAHNRRPLLRNLEFEESSEPTEPEVS